MFFETMHSISVDYYNAELGKNLDYPTHMHRSFEIFFILSGELEITVDGRPYLLKKDDCILIFPNQLHSIKTPKESRYYLCIFSPQLVQAFKVKNEGMVPKNNLFYLPKYLADSLCDENTKSSIFAKKGVLYSICSYFDKGAEYEKSVTDPKELLFRIFDFVEKNYRTNCSLKDLADHLSYDYAYISKYFRRYVDISFNEYVTQHRMRNATYLLANKNISITEIALESGFGSVRSFNRLFKQQFGVTPAEYRSNKSHYKHKDK